MTYSTTWLPNSNTNTNRNSNSEMNNTELVFVYGTLKQGEPNHYWLKEENVGKSVFISKGHLLKNYPLVIASRYNIPYLLDCPGKGHNVIGEVYKVNESMLQHLDVLEDYPKHYTRCQESVRLLNEPSETLQCWVYLLPRYKPFILHLCYLEEYSSTGDHGLPYVPRYRREPNHIPYTDVQETNI